MKPGRKPVPTQVLKLRGSWRAKNRRDLFVQPEKPRMPSWLSDEAKRAWRHMVPQLEALGILKRADEVVLAMFCTDYAEWSQACEEISTLKSRFVKQPSGRICQHPLLRIRDAAAERMRKLISELGMSPAARTGLNITQKPSPSKSKSRFFNPREPA